MKKFVPRNHTKVYPNNSYTIEQGRKEMEELRNRKGVPNGRQEILNTTRRGPKYFG